MVEINGGPIGEKSTANTTVVAFSANNWYSQRYFLPE